MELNACHKELGPIFRCDVQSRCESGSLGDFTCTNTLYTSGLISEDNKKLLENDCYEEGYYLLPVEAHFVILNSHDAEIDVTKTKSSGEKDHFRKSWYDTVKEHRGIYPLPLTKKVSGKYHLRASEHGHDLARIIAKLDKSKLKTEYGIDLENKFSSAGTTAHLLRNYQEEFYENFVHNKRLEDIGIQPIPRQLYCEMPVQLELTYESKTQEVADVIKIRGHPDVLFQFRDGHAVGALDFKRARNIPYERRSHVRQKLTYARAAAQMLNIEPEYFYGFTTNRSFESDIGNYRNPKYKLLKVPNSNTNAQIVEHNFEFARSYTKQAFILHNRRTFFNSYATLHPKEYCRPAADLLAKLMKTEKCTLADLIDMLGLSSKDWEYPTIQSSSFSTYTSYNGHINPPIIAP